MLLGDVMTAWLGQISHCPSLMDAVSLLRPALILLNARLQIRCSLPQGLISPWPLLPITPPRHLHFTESGQQAVIAWQNQRQPAQSGHLHKAWVQSSPMITTQMPLWIHVSTTHSLFMGSSTLQSWTRFVKLT